MNLKNALDDVTFDPKAHASVNYAKARLAIEGIAAQKRPDGLPLLCRAERRMMKMMVIEHFGGKVIHEESKHPRAKHRVFVQFPDSSKAAF